MLAARKQAEDYARALPVEHGYPPFLLVVDVGNVIEVYADFSGQGKNYAHFPDRQSYRIAMDDLRDEKVQARLRAIWTDPQSLDPTRVSAEVTRDIAERLAKIAKRLEGKHDAKDVAEFLMRCLFTMFAEDVKLIPEKGFHKLLGQMKDTPEHFVPALESLWAVMDSGRLCAAPQRHAEEVQRLAVQEARGAAARQGRHQRTVDCGGQGLVGCRAGDLRHAAGTRARPARAVEARRALHAARLCRAAGDPDDHRAAARRLGAGPRGR